MIPNRFNHFDPECASCGHVLVEDEESVCDYCVEVEGVDVHPPTTEVKITDDPATVDLFFTNLAQMGHDGFEE